ncbi:GspE/PulE family protein [Pelobacter propionicus]|uniref:Type II secretion system protein E n=1 Tax=Pelobacter propionicus (strain DSM 2379 / NBRC 103807 / OttBd1) TaxID=338966 RepID=A1AM75_PELPD|nr:GspE/PulE family protein [Pelobacter propionicus]ABK98445.1 type II secretion system protein E [Pelobacter propionicus DSM 2379]
MPVNETILIEAAIKTGLLREADIKTLRLQAKRERLPLLEVITRAGRFPEAALYQSLADARGIPFLLPEQLTADAEALALLPQGSRQHRLLLPVRDADGGRLLALADPDDHLSLERVERATGERYRPALAEPAALRGALERCGQGGAAWPAAAEKNDPVQFLDDVMKEVYLRRASDVHFEPQEGRMRIRLRVDGRMQEFGRMLPASDEDALLNRIKVLAGLDIAEQRMAQDGAMKYAIMNWDIPEVDIRVATIPTRWGERATMRILGQDTGRLTLEQLGMPKTMLGAFRRAIARPHGVILVTGPTGSGKSTTLYSAIRELDVNAINVLTVEDPVELPIAGVSQVQVSVKVGFAEALRSFLRHDPDVILVGEMRDRETVDIGLRAAMTGHLVMSTLHTNDAVGAVTRLLDIGAERFLIASTLTGVLAQRLVRRLCVNCCRKRPALPEELRILNLEGENVVEIYEPGGCSFCLGSGFRGRIGLFEAFWIDQDLSLAISEGASEVRIREMAGNYTTLWQDAREKVLRGEVSLAEVLHVRAEAN